MSLSIGNLDLRPSPLRLKNRVDRSARTLPIHLYTLIWRISGGDQVWLSLLAVAIAVLDTLPLEVQRRTINAATRHEGIRPIVALALTYAALALAQGGVKFISNIYRAWVSEYAGKVLRDHLNAGLQARQTDQTAEAQGREVSLIIAESGPIGAFAGESVSEPLLQAGTMVAVIAYLIVLQPTMALVLSAVYVPQALFVPWLQRRITSRVQARIAALRAAGSAVLGACDPVERRRMQAERFGAIFTLNMGIFRLRYWMKFLIGLCHQFGVAGIMGIGGCFVASGHAELGTVVAFISGLSTVKAPWVSFASWYQSMTVSCARYKLLTTALD